MTKITQDIMRDLGLDKSELAHFLGLSGWKNLGVHKNKLRSYRLRHVHEVLSYLKNKHPEIQTVDYKSLIETYNYLGGTEVILKDLSIEVVLIQQRPSPEGTNLPFVTFHLCDYLLIISLGVIRDYKKDPI